MLLYGMEEEANVLDNSHTRGNLHWTRNQRLPAGRVLIRAHPVEIARRPASRRAIAFGKRPRSVQGFRDDKCPGPPSATSKANSMCFASNELGVLHEIKHDGFP